MSAGEAAAGEGQTQSAFSPEDKTLEWQLLQGKRQMLSMLQPSLPPSAVLHPLFQSQTSISTRASFQHLLDQYKGSIRNFLDDASSVSTNLALRSDAKDEDASPSASQRQNDVRGKKQRLISLLRENSTHSTALSDAVHQLQEASTSASSIHSMNHLPALLNHGALVTPCETSWPTFSLEEATMCLERFVQVCEAMAKELHMEAFSDEHVGTSEGSTNHTHTLTLAASILVVDVEAGLGQEGEGYWSPVIRLRLSYATDSATAQPRTRDHRLADFLKSDLQALADLLLGCYGGRGDVDRIDDVSRAKGHYSRTKATLSSLKRLDDLSVGLDTVTEPDLFAVMEVISEKVGQRAELQSDPSQQINHGAGFTLQHTGWPYASLVYHAQPSSIPVSEAFVSEQANKESLAMEQFQSRIHCLSINIISSSTSNVIENDPPLPKSNNKDIKGALQYVAYLHPPVIMPKGQAHRLSVAAGTTAMSDKELSKTKVAIDRRLTALNSLETIKNNPSYEQLLSLVSTSSINEGSSNSLQFADRVKSEDEAKRKGVLVSQFSFASLEHLINAVKILRRQVQLNDLLSCVSISSASKSVDDEEPSLKDILSETKWTLSNDSILGYFTLFESEEGVQNVLVNVPLRIDCWSLEVKMYLEGASWLLSARISQLGKKKSPIDLKKDDDIYKQSMSLLNEEGGKGMKKVLEILRIWALDQIDSVKPGLNKISESVEKEKKPQAQTEDQDDQVGELLETHKFPLQEGKSKGRRVSQEEIMAPGMTTRRRSSAQSSVEEKESTANVASNNNKRRASQASLEDEDGSRRTSRRKS